MEARFTARLWNRAFPSLGRILARVFPLAGGVLLSISACDNVDQTVSNCQRTAVSTESTHNRIEPLSYFIVMGRGHDFDRQMHIYDDGSRHRAKILPGDAATLMAKKAMSNEERVAAMCRAHGPGVLAIPSR